MNDGIETFNLLTYSGPIWFITGLLLLRLDAVGFKISGSMKEYWLSKLLGWFNITAGVLCFLYFFSVKLFS